MESSCRKTISCNVDKTEKGTIEKMVKRKGKLAALLRARHDAEVRMREEIEIKERERLEWLQKQKTHQPSMTFTGTDKIQNVINYFACPKCNQKGTQVVNQKSLKGVITNLEIVCRCGSKITSWSAADEFNDAFLVSAKMNGITNTQLERFLLCLNFTAGSETSSTSICLSSVAMQKRIREINSKLIDLKDQIEKTELDRILAERPDAFIASEDGAYPNGVRTRNSGACFNTVMAYDKDKKAKIVCK